MKIIQPLVLLVLILAFPFRSSGQSVSADYEIAIFIALDCPISQKYISRIDEIYQRYADEPSIQWLFIVPRPVSGRKIHAFIAEYDAHFPLRSDNRKLRKTKHFGARVTPEVVILKEGKTLYQGAIDNWFYALGRHRPEATEHYLIDAIESILKSKDPEIPETEAVGCFIQMPEK